MKMKLDHVGWVTNDPEKFEAFWVDVLGFEKVWESYLPPELARTLFGIGCGARCLRYRRGDLTIEVHAFDEPVVERHTAFDRFGLNHIALHVEDRHEFLKQHDFDTYVYHNPKGWDNIFVRDFEGNWIELKETFE